MKCSPSKIFRISSFVFVTLYIAFATIGVTACSNSETAGADIDESAVVHCKDVNADISPIQEDTKTKNDSLKADVSITQPTSKDSIYPHEVTEITTTNDSSTASSTITEPASVDSIYSHEIVCDTIPNNLPLDDTEYPYAGIPRIVIETENFREIKDRETEIPAKLQIWGENAPESEVMELTIRGRGNNTWDYPKKPFAIKFDKKQPFLGMPNAKKWVMLANYRDRTLIRNALAFEIARQTSQEWVPQGKFVDVYLNRKFIGNYYICEKIEVNKNRLNLESDGYLLEFDTHFDERNKFTSSYKKFPINVKFPKELNSERFEYIQSYIDSIECMFYGDCRNGNINQTLHLQSFASYWIIQEIAQNGEVGHPKSVFAYKNSKLNLGPVWDYDFQTFTSFKKGLQIKNSLWYDTLYKNKDFKEIVKNEWNANFDKFYNLTKFVDSLANYISISNDQNFKVWPLTNIYYPAGDENENFSSAIQMIKKNFTNRLEELDSIFNSL